MYKMNITGIIAEFNPLHKGHVSLLQHAKKELASTFVIVVMGGNFMQRGIPAITDKYARVRFALAHGADLCLEMPVVGATASAEGFARTGACLLASTGVVSHLLFGSEHPNMDWFEEAAGMSENTSMDFYKRVNELVRGGMGYAAARERALVENRTPSFPADFLSGSNNILGIEYVRAIRQFKLPIKPVTIGRTGSPHNDTAPSFDGPSSSSAIRHAIHIGQTADVVHSLPADVVSELRLMLQNKEYVLIDDLSQILHYALLREDSFAKYADVTEDLSNKILNTRDSYTTFKEYAAALKSRDVTYTRVCRMLLHVVLGITDAHAYDLRDVGYAPYLRILGFTKRGTALLKQIKGNASIPLFASPKGVSSTLSLPAANLLDRDVHAADVYRLMLTAKTGRVHPTEYSRPFDGPV